MPDKRISELTELATAESTDVLPIVNSGETKKITTANLLGSFAPDFDYVAIDDTDSPYALAGHISIVLADTTGGDITVDLPAAAGSDKRIVWIKNIGSGTLTIDGSGAEEIDAETTQLLTQYSTAQLVCDGSEWWIL